MELIGIMLGMVFWPLLIAAWVVIGRRCHLRKWVRATGAVVLVALPLLGALSLAHFAFVDEPLLRAAADGDAVSVKRLLRLGADPNAENELGVPLERAASSGHANVVRILLAHGADVNARDPYTGHTALKSARMNRRAEVEAILLKAGATE